MGSLVAAGIAAAAVVNATKLLGGGPIQVSLEGSSSSWNRFVQVYDGAFSAQLEGTGDGTDSTATGHVVISPLSTPFLSMSESQIKFWAYWQTGHLTGGNLWVPHVELVLDNGRWLTGDQNTMPVGGAKSDLTLADTEDGHGYPDAALWTQMQVQPCAAGGGAPSTCGFYSDFAANDPCIPDSWDINEPHPISDFTGTGATSINALLGANCGTLFRTAKLVQVRISFGGFSSNNDDVIYIDDATIFNRLIKIEPDTVAVS